MDKTAGAQAAASAAGYLSPDEPIVRFVTVGMRYGRTGPEILSDLSFELAQGSFHFLTGASGAGKSSLLSMIYMSRRASRGVVEVFGHRIVVGGNLSGLRRRIGVVFQDMRLLDHVSAFDNVALPLRIARRDPKTYRDDVAELLGWVGLGDRMGALPPTLSGGERQRLAIARAVVARPDLILADEPTGNVDPAMAVRILKLFAELNRQGVTVLIASHDPDLVARARMPILHLEGGKLTRHAPGAFVP